MMKPKDIKIKLRERNCSMAVLAKVIERSPVTIQQVIERKARSKFIADKVSQVLELPTSTVFDDVPEYAPGFDAKAKKSANLNYWREKLAS